jgi:hypothetical protein
MLYPVLRTRNILILIRILGSVFRTLYYGSGSGFGSCSFHKYQLSRCQPKISVFSKFFCLLLNEGTFTPFFKDNKSLRSHKNEWNQGFS